ncbi:hypothetical protein ZPAH1_orf00255 [Aeromonas phage ZPAH1]|nr:hypothetical protein ASwh1_207 [Aeromonas phage Aswh_1]QQG34017.1 hypothetical protein ZPAH1_orf00255 [Aeromonas phage ZPAH1]
MEMFLKTALFGVVVFSLGWLIDWYFHGRTQPEEKTKKIVLSNTDNQRKMKNEYNKQVLVHKKQESQNKTHSRVLHTEIKETPKIHPVMANFLNKLYQEGKNK